MRSIRKNDIEEFRFNIDVLLGGCWSDEGDLFLLNTIYLNTNIIYLVTAEGALLSKVVMEELVEGLAFDYDKFYTNCARSIVEYSI